MHHGTTFAYFFFVLSLYFIHICGTLCHGFMKDQEEDLETVVVAEVFLTLSHAIYCLKRS